MTTTERAGHDTLLRAVKLAAAKLAAFTPAYIPICPRGDDYREVAGNVRDIAQNIVDPLIEAFGEYAREFSPHPFDLKFFKDQLHDAIEGNATYELESVAERLDEDQAEAA